MRSIINRIRSSPALIRVLPFVVFSAFTIFQGRLFEHSQYWLYASKTFLGVALVGLAWKWIPEMRWKMSWEAVVAGVSVFAFWVGLEGWYPWILSRGEPWNPCAAYGEDSLLGWIFVSIRLLGSTLVVPMIEEVFYRSFLYRWFVRPDFDQVPFHYFSWKAFLLTAVMFGLAHFEWLPAILCAFVYQGLVCRKNRLGDAMTAHAITNFLLGLWVVGRGAWRFW